MNVKRKFDTTDFESFGDCNVCFGSTFNEGSMRLIELPTAVLDYVQGGGQLEIKGMEEGKDVVLCTENQTFDLKKIENSNAMFLTSSKLDWDHRNIVIESQVSLVYELYPASPRVHQIKQVLESKEILTHGIDKSEFYSRIQASREEINTALLDCGVVEAEGKIKMIPRPLYRDVVRNLLDDILENSWDLRIISLKSCLLCNPTTDQTVLKAVLNKFGTYNGDGTWTLDSVQIAKASAHDLFLGTDYKQDKLWSCEEFLMAWNTRTPGSTENLSAELIKGIALIEDTPYLFTKTAQLPSASNSHKPKKSTCQYYRYFPKEILSLEPSTRFHELYQVRANYTSEDIEPYLEDLYGHLNQPKTMEELLLKFTIKANDTYILK